MKLKHLTKALTLAGMTTLAATAQADHHLDKTMKAKVDGSFVSLRGTVVDTADNAFLLDYGEGKVGVEVDDWDYDNEGDLFADGDKVTVFGLVDDDFYQTRTIEAESIYVDDLNTTLSNFSAADEESIGMYRYYVGPTAHEIEILGTVTSTNGREFTIDTGNKEVTVDTMLLAYNPMDDSGYQQIDNGDVVRVGGDLDIGLFEKQEVIARSVISIN